METLHKFSEICRFCLIHTDKFKRTTLTSITEKKFKELTNCTLIKFQQFSKFSCQKCLKKMEICLKIKEEFIENQKKLLDLYEKSKTEGFSLPTSSKSRESADNFDLLTNLVDLEVDLIDQIKEEAEDDINLNQFFVKKETEIFLDENGSDGNLYKCDSCSASFKTISLLTAHKEFHNILIEPKSEHDLGEYEMMETSKSDSLVISKTVKKGPKSKKSKKSVKPMAQCEICNKIVTASFLPYHIRQTHIKQYKFYCDICNKGFFTKKRIGEHVNTHFNIKDYPCDLCDLEFFTNTGMQYHKKLIHEGKKRAPSNTVHTCLQCGKTFAQKSNLTDHLKVHTDDRPYTCVFEGCRKTFKSNCTLNKHRKKVHKAREVCSICSKECKDLKSHMKNLHEMTDKAPKYTTCTICDQMVLCSYLKSHMSIHANKNKFRCDLCGRGFTTKRKISNHVKIHFKIIDYPCNFCDLGFYTNTGLAFHVKMKHLGIQMKRKIRTCEYCGQSFNIKIKYEKHISLKHKGERNFKCDIGKCERTYASKPDLNAHKKKSHAEKVECPICFKMVKILKNHKNLVHKENTVWYPCTYEEDGVTCNKKFRDKRKMEIHINGVHKDLRKYNCEECDASYQKHQDLKDHVRVKHQRIKIKCELCPTLVTQKKYYTRHIKLHHHEMDDAAKKVFLQKILDTKFEDLILINT